MFQFSGNRRQIRSIRRGLSSKERDPSRSRASIIDPDELFPRPRQDRACRGPSARRNSGAPVHHPQSSTTTVVREGGNARQKWAARIAFPQPGQAGTFVERSIAFRFRAIDFTRVLATSIAQTAKGPCALRKLTRWRRPCCHHRVVWQFACQWAHGCLPGRLAR